MSNCQAAEGIHSHYFYMTATKDQSTGIFTYTMTKTLDDITLLWYDSENEVVERRVPWFKSPYSTLYDASKNFYLQQRKLQNALNSIQYYLNHTEGYHILQSLEGCALYDNGTIQASCNYHYDGNPFLSFNVETTKWTSEAPEAERFTQILNANTTVLEKNRYLLVNVCIPHITELLALGNSTFNRKETPVVKVTQIPIDNGEVRVYCRVYEHYPKDIFIMWYKNRQQMSEEMMERVTLPIPGLTYLTSLSFNATSVDDSVYTCRVNHRSMLHESTQEWRISGNYENLSRVPLHPSNGTVIVACLAVILVIVVIVLGSVSFAKSRRHQILE
ncbi:major histocompatibility complex class I-related gene protein-like [Eleutherodactylus coqui]|uniref:major histocompatibility complex class I-related gene protein-like n=1 Tax=Eleutherodactylus coqui TaxID=57060 RepID=UPI00346266DB